jgi:acid phosphatase type 7
MLRRAGGPQRAIVLAMVFLATLVWKSTIRGDTPPPSGESATMFGVGDIMQCANPEGGELTGQLMTRLLQDTPNSIAVTFGDNSNDDGTEEQYDCFNRSSWGALNSRLYPTPGNHDYGTDKVLPFYYLYFVNAGRPAVGYRAYDFGDWRVYALNSELVSPASRQEQLDWLEEELRVHSRDKCTFAYFHRPPFSSGSFASPAWVMPIFRKLHKYGVDLVATGHEHFFASLPPLNPDGVVDRVTGIPTLIAGTGGAIFFQRPPRLRYADAGEVLVARSLGVLKITFRHAGYDWAFVPVDPQDPAPAGSGQCHDNPPGYGG